MNNNIKRVLTFMQRNDSNGTWLEWLGEISNNESEFDKSYILDVLHEWYNDSNDAKYSNMIEYVNNNLQ